MALCEQLVHATEQHDRRWAVRRSNDRRWAVFGRRKGADPDVNPRGHRGGSARERIGAVGEDDRRTSDSPKIFRLWPPDLPSMNPNGVGQLQPWNPKMGTGGAGEIVNDMSGAPRLEKVRQNETNAMVCESAYGYRADLVICPILAGKCP